MIYHIDCESRELNPWLRTLCHCKAPVISICPVAFSPSNVISEVTPSEAILYRVFFNVESFLNNEDVIISASKIEFPWSHALLSDPEIQGKIMDILNSQLANEQARDID